MLARSTALASLAALASFTGLALAASARPETSARPLLPQRAATTATPGTTAEPTGDIFYLYSAGLDEMLSNSKDAGLRASLALVEGRLIELARSQGNMPDPEKNIHALWTLAASPMEFRLAATEPGENGEPPVAFAIKSRPADPASLERTISSLLRSNDVPMRSTDGGREFDTPIGPARFSVSGNTLDLSVGQELPESHLDLDLPPGYTPVFALHANLQNAQPLIEMMLSQAPNAQESRPMLEQAGMLGDDAMVLDFACGHNDSELIYRGTLHNARARAASMGLPPDVTLDRAFLSLIPADTTQLTAGVFDLSMLDQVLVLPEVQDALAQINGELGIDIVEDILHQIGHRFALYQSDRTGGGGMLSSVLILELNDPATFARAHRRLIDAANEFAAQQIRQQMDMGRAGPQLQVEIRPRRSEGLEYFTLTWPGLPIPAEISWVVQSNRLMVALSPRSLLQAVAQASQDGPSFADSPVLTGMAGDPPADLLSVTYTDAPRFAVQGYSLVNLLCAGLSNALRTTDGPDPGIPLPAFNEFIADIQPHITVSHWHADDLTFRGRASASILANIAGSSESMIAPLAIAGAMGAVIPAMQKARESAQQAVAMANLRQIVTGVAIYSSDNRDRIPGSFDDLAEYLGDSGTLASPLGPCNDGSPDYALRTDLAGKSFADLTDPSATLAAIDRATVLNGAEMVLVAFFDGHVEALYSWQLTDLLAQEVNHGAFEAFGLPDWMNPGF